MKCSHCLLYLAGSLVAFAYDDLSHGKIASQSHTYMNMNDRYGAYNALDGNQATCMRASDIGLSSLSKSVWWKVDLGGVFNIYGINILFKKYDDAYEDRQRGRFAGFSMFVSKTGDIIGASQCYRDGPKLPPLRFTCICTESGRYVIFYNERLEGVTYPFGYEVENVITELCEVTVEGCDNASVYGINCDRPCPTNCQENRCHIQSGACETCKPGWTGVNCNTKCGEGWYSENCTEQCVGHCKAGTSCNHVTGHCDGGCDAGWTGSMCDKECENGSYGYHCVNNCSGHCLNNSPCNKQTGHCDMGCIPGYTHGDCSKDCSSGYFGMYCRERCSGHCTNSESCDHVSGECTSGCQDGFIGARCNYSCKEGYFGTNCSRECSPNCKPYACRHTDGSCTFCAAGWIGNNCTIACNMSFGVNCVYPCNIHCINQACDRLNGSCLYGCEDGHKCDEVIAYGIGLSALSNLPISIGLVGACVCTVIGLVLAIFVIRRKSSCTLCNTRVSKLCLRSTSAAEENVKNENMSTYQELNFTLQENPYQCILR